MILLQKNNKSTPEIDHSGAHSWFQQLQLGLTLVSFAMDCDPFFQISG